MHFASPAVMVAVTILRVCASATLPGTLLLATHAFGQNPGDVIFAGTQVHTINILLPQPAYWDSLTSYYEAGDEQCIMATVVINGVPFDSVGVRFKGNSSYTYPGVKKSFKLEFDYFGKDVRWDGEKSVHLNNGWGDPSFMREKVHLDFCRDAGIPAPRANYVRLLINDTVWGLYNLVEHVDKRFLKTHYGDSGGELFKAVDAFGAGAPGVQLYSDFRWYGTADTSYTKRYEHKSDDPLKAWPWLITFIDSLNHSTDLYNTLHAKMNVQAYLNVLATDIIFGNLDSYVNSGRNFYFYSNPTTNLAEWIVWDVGLSFGSYSAGVSKVETMPLTYVAGASQRPLVSRIHSNEFLRNEYLMTLCRLAAARFQPSKLFPHIDSIAALIRPYVSEDPNKMYTLTQFETNIQSDVNAPGGAGMRKPGLKSFITARQASINTQLADAGINCTLGIDNAGRIVPGDFFLLDSYPNPFSKQAVVAFRLERSAAIRMSLYSMLGVETVILAEGTYERGDHVVTLDGAALAPGMYICTISDGSARSSRMLVRVK